MATKRNFIGGSVRKLRGLGRTISVTIMVSSTATKSPMIIFDLLSIQSIFFQGRALDYQITSPL